MHGIKGTAIALLLMLAITPAFSAQESSILLEKAIYAEETLGNLNDAINLYRQIANAADAGRTTAALALYRLGMCYRKSGREADALAAFSNLARLYPEQKDLILKSQLLELKAAPWVDGEVMRLGLKSPGLKGELGTGTFSVESGQEAGKSTWTFRYFIGLAGIPLYSTTIVDAGTMVPISSRYQIMNNDWNARYASDQVEVVNLKADPQTKKQVALTGIVYDTWQITHLLRCMALREGFEFSLPVFNTSSSSIANFKFTVAGREKITVPAGAFECYKVTMTPDDSGPQQVYWISADSHSYLVKTIEADTSQFELKSIDIIGKNQTARVEDSELGISLPAPPRWYPSHTINSFTLTSPELNSSLTVTAAALRPEEDSVAKTVDRWVLRHTETGSYQVRPGTRETAAVAGLTGERYIADTNHITGGEPIVEYAYIVAGTAKKYIFTFQTGRENFDKMKPSFEAIVSGIRIQ